MKKYRLPIIILISILACDQLSKILVKTTMFYREQYFIIGKWFRIFFIENNGMAFGYEFGGDYGKIVLSIFRLVAGILIGWYIYDLVKKNAPKGLIISMTLILAGAIGNLIDCAFYGLIFDESSIMQVAKIFPTAGGYASFLHGRVVDMLYFPIIDSKVLPSWIPVFGGRPFTFFSPVFNIADSSITIGVFWILLFQRSFFKKRENEK